MVDQNFKTYFLLQKSCKIAVLIAVALEKLTDEAVDFGFPVAMICFSSHYIILQGLEHHLELFWSLEVLKPAIICRSQLIKLLWRPTTGKIKLYSCSNRNSIWTLGWLWLVSSPQLWKQLLLVASQRENCYLKQGCLGNTNWTCLTFFHWNIIDTGAFLHLYMF